MRRETVLFIGRRLLQVVPVVLAIAALNFVLIKMAPGDAADILAGQMGHATLEFTQQLRKELQEVKKLARERSSSNCR